MALIDEEKKKRAAPGLGVTPSAALATFASANDAKATLDQYAAAARGAPVTPPAPAPAPAADFKTFGSPEEARLAMNQYADSARASMPAVQPAAAAPVVADPAAPGMSYGAQMRKVGGAIADAGATIAKTIVGAPGYGVNRLVNPELNPQDLNAGAGAGAGRGSVNPAAVVPATAAPVQVATGVGSPTQTVGAAAAPAGVSVPGAPGVTKIVGADGRTTYTDGTTAPSTAVVSTVPAGVQPGAGIGAAVAAPTAEYDQPGVLSNGPGMRVVGGSSFFRRPGDPETAPLSTLGVGRISGREASRQANAASIAAQQAATARANSADANATAQAGHRLTADTQRATAASQAAIAAAKLAAEAPEQQAKAGLAVQTLQARNEYAKALQSGDPKRVQAAEDNLRAIQGKYEKDPAPELFSTIPIPAGVDPVTGMPRGAGAIITNKRDGTVKIISPDEARGAPAAGGAVANATPKAQYDKLQRGEKYVGPDGKQYIKG